MFLMMNLYAELVFLQCPLVPVLTGMSWSGTEGCLHSLDTYRAARLKADVANEGHSSDLCWLSPVSLYLAVHKQPFVVSCCTHSWAQEEAPRLTWEGCVLLKCSQVLMDLVRVAFSRISLASAADASCSSRQRAGVILTQLTLVLYFSARAHLSCRVIFFPPALPGARLATGALVQREDSFQSLCQLEKRSYSWRVFSGGWLCQTASFANTGSSLSFSGVKSHVQQTWMVWPAPLLSSAPSHILVFCGNCKHVTWRCFRKQGIWRVQRYGLQRIEIL